MEWCRRNGKWKPKPKAKPKPVAVDPANPPIGPASLVSREIVTGGVWLGTDPPRPAGVLLTADEAVSLLRLDKVSAKPLAMLARCVTRHGLPVLRGLGGAQLYRRSDLVALVERLAR